MKTSLALVVSALSLLASACGPAQDMACSDSAKAQCMKLDQCRHNGTTLVYGNLGTCITRLQAQCNTALAAANTGNSPSAVEDCVKAVPGESCQDYLQGNPVAACRAKSGSVSAGGACTFSAQCQSAFCALLKGTACGTCANPPNVGDPCTDTGCSYNQACSGNLVCANWVAAGGACDKSNPCAPNTWCVTAAGATAGTCRASIATVGAACDPKHETTAGCDFTNLGLRCNSMTMKCESAVLVNEAEACGVINGVDNVCQAGAGCFGQPAACVAAATEGSSCDTMMGPPCLSPARCVTGSTGTAGTCTLLDPTMCL